MTDSFEDLYEHAPCGYLSTTLDGVVSQVNETFLIWTGFLREEVLGQSFKLLLAPASHIFYETRYLPMLRLAGSLREVALTVRCADGRSLPVFVNSTPQVGSDGVPLSVRTAIFDATERHDLERQLVSARRIAESSEARVRVLQDASSSFTVCNTEEALAEALVGSSMKAFRATAAAVMLTDALGTLRVVAGTHDLDPLLAKFGPRPDLDAVRTGRIITISSVAEASLLYPGLEDTLRAIRIEALIIVPLRASAQTLGVLVCLYGRKRIFDDGTRELHDALARQGTQVLERVRLQKELSRLALYDHLTGLANRELLTRTLDTVLASAARHRCMMALIFFDLDGFKAVNDQLGHVAGDSVLIEIAQRLRGQVRETDTIARFGGDEFVVVCASVEGDAAQGLAERIRFAVQHPLTGAAAGFRVTASIGLAVYDPDKQSQPTATTLLRMADSAMYTSKEFGKDRVTTLYV